MKRKPMVKVQVVSHGMVVYSARATAVTGNTMLDVSMPEDIGLQREIGDLFIMLAHDLVQEAWKQAKLLSVLASTGTTEPRSVSKDEYLSLLNGDTGAPASVPDDLPF